MVEWWLSGGVVAQWWRVGSVVAWWLSGGSVIEQEVINSIKQK